MPATSTSVVIACPACARSVRLVKPREGETFACPRCSHEFAYPPQAQVESVPAQSALPPASGPEVEVLRTCPSYLRVHPWACLGTGFLTLAALGLAAWVALRGGAVWLAGLCVGVALVQAVLFSHGWLRTKASELCITNKRLIDRDGLLTRQVSEVLHKDIRNVRIRQTLWQRVRGVGELAVSTDGDEGPEIYMACVTHPHRVREVIDHYRLG